MLSADTANGTVTTDIAQRWITSRLRVSTRIVPEGSLSVADRMPSQSVLWSGSSFCGTVRRTAQGPQQQ